MIRSMSYPKILTLLIGLACAGVATAQSQEIFAYVFNPRGLTLFNPDFRPDWIRQSWLHKASYAQPVPLVHHSRNIPDLQTPIPSLYFASMSQVYPWDRGTNFAVEIGRRVAQRMIQATDHNQSGS